MRIITITKDDLQKMDPDQRNYFVAAAKTRKRQRRVNRVKRAVKGTILTGAAAVIYAIGTKNHQEK